MQILTVTPRRRPFWRPRALGRLGDTGNYYQGSSADAVAAGLKVQWPGIQITSGPTLVGSVTDAALAAKIGVSPANPGDGNAGYAWYLVRYILPGEAATSMAASQGASRVYAAERAAEANAVPINARPIVSSLPASLIVPTTTGASGNAQLVAGNSFAPSPTATTYAGSPTTVANAQAAQAAAAPATSWWDGSTDLLGYTFSNQMLTIGAVVAAAALWYFSSGKKKR